jgi:hypothetical protein
MALLSPTALLKSGIAALRGNDTFSAQIFLDLAEKKFRAIGDDWNAEIVRRWNMSVEAIIARQSSPILN